MKLNMLVLGAVCGFGLVSCGGGDKPAATTTTTEAPAMAKESAPVVDVAAAQKVMAEKLCLTCHTLDGTTEINGAPALGPTLKGVFGSQTTVIANGQEITKTVDEAYLRKSINEPMAEIKKDFQPVMAPLPMTPEELDLVISYVKTLK
ncbi:MAG: cytochrome c [Candidatus Delongbacteria bacterium]|nr:cytochrome c [Candidatus Cloacimonadota bacterium]MCB9473728.1 cytochrome c [Candidatus Delongbacteria bacterium]